MQSLQTFTHKSGFSLIEILIVMAIVGVIMFLSVIAGIDSLARTNFNAEIENAVAVLQKARSESINNIGGVAHGIHFPAAGATDPDSMIIFKGGNSEFSISRNPASTYSANPVAAKDINFEQLTGRVTACVTACVITITDNGGRTDVITINYEGGIDY